MYFGFFQVKEWCFLSITSKEVDCKMCQKLAKNPSSMKVCLLFKFLPFNTVSNTFYRSTLSTVSNLYVYSIFTPLLMKQIFEKNESLRAATESERLRWHRTKPGFLTILHVGQ